MRPRTTGTVVALLTLGALAVATLLARGDPTALAFVLGPLNPVLVTALACALGLAGLAAGLRGGWIPSLGGSHRACLLAGGLGALLTAPSIVIDLFGGFPADINLPPPQAYFAYPAIALVAEFAFHTLPIGVVALAARALLDRPSRARPLALGLAVLPEPILQVAWSAQHSPTWTLPLVLAQLVVFNVAAVLALTRYGFLPAFALRLGYYAVWHLGWGQMRLHLLFGA